MHWVLQKMRTSHGQVVALYFWLWFGTKTLSECAQGPKLKLHAYFDKTRLTKWLQSFFSFVKGERV